jgi:hypothetical protein
MSGRDGTMVPKSDETANWGERRYGDVETAELRELRAAARDLAEQCGIDLGGPLYPQIVKRIEKSSVLRREEILGLLTIVRTDSYLTGPGTPTVYLDLIGRDDPHVARMARVIRKAIVPTARRAS